ncbi:hypothetical protein AJ78_06284 [Emergomyces pasteurianus Ep9510]|uniref:Fungal calcium binding protein domain-containing protein n=1 Tax=Emergomyces pasteurianus Ep9510 TaxID=1447872 RepID=A0A1J9PB34_9EURO|nr:hypothetical protein AJ78_06284 [Emergomyces pasteurianus Ep9510]
MKLSTTIAPLMLVAAAAAAERQTTSEAKAALNDYNAAVDKIKTSAEAAGCDWVGCIASLASYTSACALAAAQGGINIPLDIACIASVGAATSACGGCP